MSRGKGHPIRNVTLLILGAGAILWGKDEWFTDHAVRLDSPASNTNFHIDNVTGHSDANRALGSPLQDWMIAGNSQSTLTNVCLLEAETGAPVGHRQGKAWGATDEELLGKRVVMAARDLDGKWSISFPYKIEKSFPFGFGHLEATLSPGTLAPFLQDVMNAQDKTPSFSLDGIG